MAALQYRTACPDWERRIIAGESIIPVRPLFPEVAESALQVMRNLQLVDVTGMPKVGEICRPWIMDFAAALFGSYDPQTGKRLINEYFMLIAKKNGKSTLASAIMLTALILNWRASAEFLILAPTKEAADNAFRPAEDMVRASEELSTLMKVQSHPRIIEHGTTGATLKVIAADGQTVVGKKAGGILVDELWEFGKKKQGETLLMEATGGMASRPEGFVIYLSTQSSEPPAGVFRSKLNLARKIRDGVVENQSFLPVIYEFPRRLIEAEKHHDPAFWHIANPNLGASVAEDFLRSQYQQKKEAGPGVLTAWMAKHLNVEVGLAQYDQAWSGARYWQKQGVIDLTLPVLLERASLIVIGIDGGGNDDFLSMAVLGRDKLTDRWLHWQKSWVSREVLELRKEDAPRYVDFEMDGDLVLVDDRRDDIKGLCDVTMEIFQSGKLALVGLDPNGVADIVFELEKGGIPHAMIRGVAQSYANLNGATKSLERKLADGSLIHGARPIMAWAVGNAKAELRGNNVVISKQMAGGKKIDPLMALIDAAACMADHPELSSGGSMQDFLSTGIIAA
ncbi:Aldehyde dehydrogenase (NADP(+)) [Acetobacteraceae bacterium EV16G]|uniref:Aldehyde dehydrogenase (NADP(+)) n=1 Tax=Sorlinia euscelidii TaxID=3081148 RepID=A0ABU7U2B0_9PROT